MKKLFSLLAIAALIMLCSCSKSETDPEAPENSYEAFDVVCEDCNTLYHVKGQTWTKYSPTPIGSHEYVYYADPTTTHSVYADLDGEDGRFVPFYLQRNNAIIKWNCVGTKDGKPCGKELTVAFTCANNGAGPGVVEHILL